MTSNHFVWTKDTEIIDLSHSLDDKMSLYPGDPCFRCRAVSTVEDDGCAVTAIQLGSHTGTHLDAPSHFVLGGRATDAISLNILQGHAAVINVATLEPKHRVTREELEAAFTSQFPSNSLSDFRIVLVRTGWSSHWGEEKYNHHPFLDADIAQYLIGSGIKVIGVDTLSPDATSEENGSNDFRFHQTFLGSGGVIVENLTNLDWASGSTIFVNLLPLKLKGTQR